LEEMTTPVKKDTSFVDSTKEDALGGEPQKKRRRLRENYCRVPVIVATAPLFMSVVAFASPFDACLATLCAVPTIVSFLVAPFENKLLLLTWPLALAPLVFCVDANARVLGAASAITALYSLINS